MDKTATGHDVRGLRAALAEQNLDEDTRDSASVRAEIAARVLLEGVEVHTALGTLDCDALVERALARKDNERSEDELVSLGKHLREAMRQYSGNARDERVVHHLALRDGASVTLTLPKAPDNEDAERIVRFVRTLARG